MATDWSLSDILEATGGRQVAGLLEPRFGGIGIDSRQIPPEALFVAICGETHDGHRFVTDVVRAGVRGVVVNDAQAEDIAAGLVDRPEVSVVAVPDTTHALGRLGRYHRRRIGIPVVALTGSNGKTTTRAMAQQVLATQFSVLATVGNLNNAIGLPLTLLRLTPEHEVAIVEMGMNHPGEIDYLGGIAEPETGIITNVAPAHLEGLGSIDGVRDAKGELLARIQKDGTALLNADDPKVLELVPRSPVRTVLYGESKTATVRAVDIEDRSEGLRFRLITPEGDTDVRLRVNGRFMVSNALAAAAAGRQLGLSPEQIRSGLERFVPVKGRMEVRSAGRIRIIDDTYNANPASMAAALRTLESLKGGNRGIAVLGDMLELGDAAAALHRELGEGVGRSDVHALFAAGDFSEELAAGARAAGMAAEQIITGEVEDLAREIPSMVKAGDWVLVKGSRGMRMERVVERLMATASEDSV